MTEPGTIVCVDWRGPFFVRFDYVRRPKSERPTVYRIDDGDETVYIGCTRHSVPYRLGGHIRAKTPLGALLREVRAGRRRASVRLIEGASYALEARLIEAARPRFDIRHADPAGDGACHLNPERRFEVLAMRTSGLTLQAIGDHFGVTRQAIHQMLRGMAA